MIVTSEYVYDNIKLNETRNIVQNTIDEFEKEYGFHLYRNVKVRCVGYFYDKIRNEIIIVTIGRYDIIEELKKIMQKSEGEIRLVNVKEIKIIFEGKISKNIMDMYFKSKCMPLLWKKLLGAS